MKPLRLRESLDLLIDNRGKNPPFVSQGIPAVTAMSVAGGALDLTACRFVASETWAAWMPFPTAKDDVLLTSEAPLGRVALVPNDDPILPSQRIFCMRGKQGVLDSRFLYYSFQTKKVQADLQSRATGTTVVGIRQPALLQISILAPSFPQQVEIAEILGALDDKIRANRELAKCSARLALAMFDGALQRHALDVKLADVAASVTRGITPLYTNAPESPIVLNQKCIRDQRVSMDLARLTDSDRLRSDKVLKMNDVLINSTGQGTLGRVARWTRMETATVDTHITIVRFDKSKIDPVCGGYGILRAQPAIQEMGEGSTGQTELSRVNLSRLTIAVPQPDSQGELGSLLADLVRAEDSYLRENAILAETRDLLLPQLMSGKLRVKDAEKQVEAVV